jgi:hypothetical protein
MVHTRILARRDINSLTKNILYWRMPKGIKIVGLPKKLLSITY